MYLRFSLFLLGLLGFSQQGWSQCDTVSVSGDLVISTDTLMSGWLHVDGLFRVENGVTVTVEPFEVGGCGELEVEAGTIEVFGVIDAVGAGWPGGDGGPGATAGLNVAALDSCILKDSCLAVEVEGGWNGAAGAGAGGGNAGNTGGVGSGSKQECSSFSDIYGFIGGSGGGSAGAGGSYGGSGSSGQVGGSAGLYNSTLFNLDTLSSCGIIASGNGGVSGITVAAYGTENGSDIAMGSGGAGAGGGGRSHDEGMSGEPGGSGGGKVVLISNGEMIVSGIIDASGSDGGNGGMGGNGGASPKCCSDLCNDCGESSYSSGAGGGGGAGGGSGGGIYLSAVGVATIDGTLIAEGGNGGQGASGGSGSATCVYSDLFCGSTSASISAGSSGGVGGGGSGGRIKIGLNQCELNNVSPSVIVLGGNGAEVGTYSNAAPSLTSQLEETPVCLVTVDSSSSYMQVVWEKPLSSVIDSFLVYREVVSGNFQLVGSVDYDDLSVFNDLDADPSVSSYAYRLSAKDSCGTESMYEGDAHRSIFLDYLGNGQLEWSEYSIAGQPVQIQAYNIYRDESGTGSFSLLTTLSSSSNTYTDITQSSFPNARYYVEVDWALSCTPSRSIDVTRSNIQPEQVTVGIEQPYASGFKLYPNPTQSSVTVALSSATEDTSVIIYDVSGKVVYYAEVSQKKTVIPITGLQRGVYFVKVGVSIQKLVVN